MKFASLLLLLSSIIFSCSTKKSMENKENLAIMPKDTLRIENKELEYEVIILEPGFNMWLQTTAKPRNYYDQSYLETRNRIWVTNYNIRVSDRGSYHSQLYELPIDYQRTIDYGYEVNYLLYNYLVYFQLHYKQRLGMFEPRL
ncbi:DUF6146 family protein [Flavobacterium sp.]|uniref:DUF6146 family protein n=1 Tax=Flavobacterium sp. TaxID=239 RepID=UPI0026166EFC|nr:DUF6146 family protein [Flavobacterium sp.]MDD2987041.1 DUF6146 family protein [Flavobacterium sp.]